MVRTIFKIYLYFNWLKNGHEFSNYLILFIKCKKLAELLRQIGKFNAKLTPIVRHFLLYYLV